MGIEIVKASIVHGKRLSGNAYKVLVVMAMSALDKPRDGRPASLYFGGWGALAVSLGYDPEAANDRNSAGHKAVKRAVRELRDGSHITPMVDAHRGSRQSYFVHPGGFGKGDQNGPVKGDHFDPVKGDQNGPQRGTRTVPPRKELGLDEDLLQDISNPACASTTDRATLASQEAIESSGRKAHSFVGSSDDHCEVCGLTALNLVHARHRRRRTA